MGMLTNAEDARGHRVLQKGRPQCSEQALLEQDGEVKGQDSECPEPGWITQPNNAC